VTALLKDIHRAVKSLRPAAVLTAAVGVQKDEALARFQVGYSLTQSSLWGNGFLATFGAVYQAMLLRSSLSVAGVLSVCQSWNSSLVGPLMAALLQVSP
jgi:hypothetical protein